MESYYCPVCEKTTPHNHGEERNIMQLPEIALHVFLMLLLCGLWLFPFLFIMAAAGYDPYWQCLKCGTRTFEDGRVDRK